PARRRLLVAVVLDDRRREGERPLVVGGAARASRDEEGHVAVAGPQPLEALSDAPDLVGEPWRRLARAVPGRRARQRLEERFEHRRRRASSNAVLAPRGTVSTRPSSPPARRCVQRESPPRTASRASSAASAARPGAALSSAVAAATAAWRPSRSSFAYAVRP